MIEVKNGKFFLAITLVMLLILYHLSILFGLLPADNVWLGRLKTPEDILYHELTSISLLFIALMFMIFNLFGLLTSISRYIYLFYALLFFMNFIANLFAKNNVELYLFSPLTLFMSYLFLKISKEIVNEK